MREKLNNKNHSTIEKHIAEYEAAAEKNLQQPLCFCMSAYVSRSRPLI